jgi:AraC-like DNA-binding protein
MENQVQDALLFTSVECFLHTTERPDFPIREHWHYFGEIVRVLSGSLKVTCRDSTFRLNAGDAIFLNPLTPHALNYGEPGVAASYEIIRLDMEQFGDLPSYSPDLRGMLLEGERLGYSILLTARDLRDSHMDNMIDQCVQEYRNQAYGYDLRIRSLLYLFFTGTIRRWISAGFIPQNYASRIDPIYSLPAYIARHIQESLKVDDLAKFCGLSYPWFSRRFHETYGMSCKEYIEKVRLRRVEHYLQFTDCDLSYISEHTGYADCSHLVRDFKKFTNTTPGQFRRAHRQKRSASASFPKTIDTPVKNG